MSFPTYHDYKDSGVPWLGHMPAGWSVGRIKDFFEIRKRIAGELGHDVLSITQSGLRVKNVEANEGQQAMDYSKYQKVLPGEFAMNHMDLLTGWIDIATQSGVTSPDYRVFGARDPEAVDAGYFLLVFQMAYSARQFFPFGQGSSQLGRWRLSKDEFYAFPVPIPPLNEQKQIRHFLGRETAKIDRLVEEQEQLIALLKEKRQAVVSHAVTKGLKPDVTLKDSGVKWIGRIPAHWEVSRLDRLMSFTSGKAHEPFIDEDGEHIYVSARFVSTQGRSLKYCTENLTPASKGDVVMVMSDLPNGIALARAYQIQDDRSYAVNQRVCLLSNFVGDSSFFAFQLDRNPGLLRYNDGLNQTHLSNSAYCKLPLLEPPLDEQREIAAFLQREMSFSSELELNARQAIELLQERKSALISAAVTGKIDVRGLVEQHEMEAA